MSNEIAYYTHLRNQASDLRSLLGESLHNLTFAERKIEEIAEADLGVSGELSAESVGYLGRSVADALYCTKMAQEINNGNVAALDHELQKVGVDPVSILDRGKQ